MARTRGATGGIFRKGSVWIARKEIPADARATIGRREFLQSLGPVTLHDAAAMRNELEVKWVAEIARARSARDHARLDLEAVEDALLGWGMFAAVIHQPRRFKSDELADIRTPFGVSRRITALKRFLAGSAPSSDIPSFEAVMGDAMAVSGVPYATTHPQADAIERLFAKIWLERLQASEHRRQSATAKRILSAPVDEVGVLPSPPTYEPTSADHSIGELIVEYRRDRETKHGVESTTRKYKHIFSALDEVLGSETPIRAVTHADAKRVKALISRIPTHAGKRFPGLSITQAISAADESDTKVKRIAPNTINSYLSNFSAMLNYALDQDWVERNVATGLIEKVRASVKRRGFNDAEAQMIFDSLNGDKSWKFWLTLILYYTGARANEIAQARTADIRSQDGIYYLAISEFAPDGKRVDDKRLKTISSERNLPLRQELIDAGLLDFVKRDGRLFPELKLGPHENYCHEVSKWFGNYLLKREIDKLDFGVWLA